MRVLLTVLIIVVTVGVLWLIFIDSDNTRENTAFRNGATDTFSEDATLGRSRDPGGTTSDTAGDTGVATGTRQNDTTVVVTYSEEGFAPRTVTVALGDTVRFVNENNNSMWVATDEHPTHTLYSGTSLSQHCGTAGANSESFDQCESGEIYSFTFEKAGTWNYHNHLKPGDQGTIVVQ